MGRRAEGVKEIMEVNGVNTIKIRYICMKSHGGMQYCVELIFANIMHMSPKPEGFPGSPEHPRSP